MKKSDLSKEEKIQIIDARVYASIFLLFFFPLAKSLNFWLGLALVVICFASIIFGVYQFSEISSKPTGTNK